MDNTPIFTTQELIHAVRAHYPAAPTTLTITPCRTGKFNATFFVEANGMRDVVIRIAPPDDSGLLFYERNMMAQEPALHRILRDQTQIPVPEILAYDTTCKILPRNFLLMERLPGIALSEAHGLRDLDVASIFRKVGEHLADAHSLHADAYGYLGKHRPMTPQSSWRAAFRIMWDSLVSDTHNCNGYSDDEAAMMKHLLDPFESIFDRDIPPSLLHMDIWHQNILVDTQGEVTGIVDWDRALWGDPEIEFAVLDYCGVSVPEFWEGYGRARDESSPAQIRNRFYLLYEVQKYILISLLRRQNRVRAEQYRQHVFGLATALRV